GPGPRPEVLGCELRAHRLPEIVVDVGRGHGAPAAIAVDVLKELLARKVLTSFDDACEPCVGERHRMSHTALAAELQLELVAAYPRVPVVQGRQSVRSVGSRVVAVADAGQRTLQQLHDRGDDVCPGQCRRPQVDFDATPELRKRASERHQTVVLGLVPDLAPARVIPILLASARVASGGLQVCVWRGGDPYVRPRRGDGQPANPRERRLVGDGASMRPDVAETVAAADTPDARRRVADVSQT